MSSTDKETRFVGVAVLFPMVLVGVLFGASAISPWLELPAIGICLLILGVFLYRNPFATPTTERRNGVTGSRTLVRAVALALVLFGLALVTAGALAFSRGEVPKGLLA